VRIVVCVKQVPETTEIKMDPATNTLIREGVESIINPFDLYAIEEGIRLREKFGGEVYILSPPQAESSLREALSLGADRAFLLCDKTFAGADTLSTGYTLAASIKKIEKVDIVLCGRQAIDGDTGQVGPIIGEHLDIVHITNIRKIINIIENKQIIFEIML